MTANQLARITKAGLDEIAGDLDSEEWVVFWKWLVLYATEKKCSIPPDLMRSAELAAKPKGET